MGTFVIFSIYAKGEKKVEGYDFTRFELKKLQDQFLKEYPELTNIADGLKNEIKQYYQQF